MTAFLISVLLFLFAFAMVVCMGGMFVALASLLTGAFLACFVKPIEMIWKRNTDKPQRSWEMWALWLSVPPAVVWVLFSINILITHDFDMVADARSMLTFGWAEPSKRHQPVETVKTEVRRYKLLGMNPPKHFYVELEDVVTKQHYESIHVSKHCNSHASNRLGDEYNINVTTYKQGDRTWLQFNDLYSVFCN